MALVFSSLVDARGDSGVRDARLHLLDCAVQARRDFQCKSNAAIVEMHAVSGGSDVGEAVVRCETILVVVTQIGMECEVDLG